MRRNRFPNKVATSYFTFPVAVVFSTLLWWSEGTYSFPLLIGWGFCMLTTYLWVETNNTYSLLRIRSRLTASAYALLAGTMFFLHPHPESMYIACAMLLSYYLLFGAYQQPQAVMPLFHTFLVLGIGSLFFPQLLYFLPVYLWYSALQVHALTWRTFRAAIVGVILPYWFYAGYSVYMEDFSPFIGHFRELAAFQPLCGDNYAEWGLSRIVSLSYVAVFAAIGMFHYVHTSFNDKIRTRMLLYVLLIQEILIAAFLLLQPVHFNTLFGLLVMNSVPFISHYFAQTDTRLARILFIICTLGFIVLTIFNLWTHLSTF